MTSLPVPVSPVKRTGCAVRAARHTARSSARPRSDWVTYSGVSGGGGSASLSSCRRRSSRSQAPGWSAEKAS
jgi:hypothetical protein